MINLKKLNMMQVLLPVVVAVTRMWSGVLVVTVSYDSHKFEICFHLCVVWNTGYSPWS